MVLFLVWLKKKLMENKTIEVVLYDPHKKQEELHNLCMLESKNFWTICISGRQAGKTIAAENQAIYWSLSDPNSLIWFVSPTEAQATEIYKAILFAAGSTNLIKSSKATKGSIEIIWTNGSRIQFKSASSENSLRGASVNYLILDEAAYIKKSTLEEIILPTLTAAGKKGLIISTPKGKNWLFNWYLKGLDKKNKQFKSIKFTSEDNPYANKELIKTFKSNLPTEIFNQEFMAEFVDSASVFRNLDEISTLILQSEPSNGEIYHSGIDIGMLHDDTVITILNNKGEMVYYDAFTGLESPEIKDRLLATLRKWNPISALMEENNQGLPILQLLQRDWPNIDGFTTTNERKGEIINQLIAAFSAKELRLIKDDKLSLQLQGFIFEMTATGKVRYKAASGFHDDMVMSLAIAWEAYVKNKSGNRYQVMSEANAIPTPMVRFGKAGDVQTGNYMIMGSNRPPEINPDGYYPDIF